MADPINKDGILISVIDDFIANVLSGTGTVMEAIETDPTADFMKPFNPLYFIIDQLL